MRRDGNARAGLRERRPLQSARGTARCVEGWNAVVSLQQGGRHARGSGRRPHACYLCNPDARGERLAATGAGTGAPVSGRCSARRRSRQQAVHGSEAIAQLRLDEGGRRHRSLVPERSEQSARRADVRNRHSACQLHRRRVRIVRAGRILSGLRPHQRIPQRVRPGGHEPVQPDLQGRGLHQPESQEPRDALESRPGCRPRH